jgi:gamma-glutamyltranspeptidase/glutathione hydrolase
MGTRGMMAASHYLAAAAGYTMLRRGGSAADAAVASNATLSVVYNHMAGLGGDCFAQIWDPKSGKVHAMNGSGRSGERVTIEAYKSKGWDEIHPRGPLAANTVPGVVAAWEKIHERFGKLDWAELFGPAIHYAEHGYPMTQKLRDYVYSYRDTLKKFDESSRIFLPGGRAPTAGNLFKQPDLANSLKMIAEKGASVFYEGALAEKIVQGLQAEGGLLTRDDFAAHTSDWVEPLRTTYKGYEVTELPPNTQGIATLMLLNLVENFDLQAMGQGTADYYHLMTEAVKLAFADRDRWVTDPEFLDIPYEKLLSKERAAERAKSIDMQRAAAEEEVKPGVGGDTVYMCAVDDDGMAVSLIQSPYFEFGSAFIPSGTGIFMQNRGSFFSLDPEAPNHLEPRKRTFHTIIPAMALKDGKPALCFGTMGGEGQPQTQTAMLTRIVDFGFNVQEAIEAPRWLYGRTWGAASKSLKLEARVPDGTLHELERRGHTVEVLKRYSQSMGHAQAIWIDREAGTLHGGADPRGEGLAIGF